jgi:periplasmic copper chaperone A
MNGDWGVLTPASILKHMKGLIAHVAALLLALTSATWPATIPPAGRITSEAGWTRAMPPGATVSAGYLRLRNMGPSTDRLLAARSTASQSVEVHATTMIDGGMQMRQIELLELGSGAVLNLAPGGMHLMLIGLLKPLKAGDIVTVTLEFAHAGRVDARLRVRPISATGP